MTETVRKLMEQRAAALQKARALLDQAEAEGRNLNESEQAQYDGFDQEIDTLTTRIEREERQAQRERDMAMPAAGDNPSTRSQPGGRTSPTEDRTASTEYRQALARYMFGGDVTGLIRDHAGGESRAILGMNIGTPAAGGILAPAVLERTLLDFSSKNYVMRRLASVRSSASDVEIPYSTGGTKAVHLDEGQEFTKSQSGFAKLSMGAYKVGALTVVTNEALADVFVDLEGFVRDEFGKAFGDLEEADFITGDGTKKPRGFLLDATVGLTAASATAVMADELLDLQEALKQKFDRKATWLLSPSARKLVRKLKLTTGEYIWQPGLQAGAPNTLLGRPVETSEVMPAVGSATTPIAYGDFSWYRILDRQGLYFQRLNELYAASGQVGFLAYKRYDGKLLDAKAIQVLKMKT